MSWEAIGALGEWAGAVVVLITLVYLATQVRQNTASVQSTGWQAWSKGTAEYLVPIAQSRDLTQVLVKGWANPKLLDHYNWAQFMTLHQYLYNQIEATYQMHVRGAVAESVWEKERARGAAMLSLPGTADWWDAGGRNQVSNNLRDLLEAARNERADFSVLWWDEDRGFYEIHDRAELLAVSERYRESP